MNDVLATVIKTMGINFAKDQTYWLHKLANLKVDRASGDPAPHKPFLLLMIIEMVEHGEIEAHELPLSPNLAFRFSLFNSIISARQRPLLDIRLPFHHLKTSGIWQPLMADGSPSPHRNLTVKVRLDGAFNNCLQDKTFREKAKRILIETAPYFNADERAALYAMLHIMPKESNCVEDEGEVFKIPAERGRDARFRIEVVVVAYRHTCALTGYRMTTLDTKGMESIVDAAHIHPFSDSRNNDPRNGLALSKNAHWQFDRGLWSITEDYRVIVNHNKFSEKGIPGQCLADFIGRKIILPADPKYWPDQEYLSWHRTNRFEQ